MSLEKCTYMEEELLFLENKIKDFDLKIQQVEKSLEVYFSGERSDQHSFESRNYLCEKKDSLIHEKQMFQQILSKFTMLISELQDE